MYMIEIEESKVSKMSELVQSMLRIGGQLMKCLEDCEHEDDRDDDDDYRHESRRRRGDRDYRDDERSSRGRDRY